jgi:deoxyribonuclease IV
VTAGEFVFGTVGSPLSTPKKPGGTVGGIQRLAELKLGALELAWVQSVRVTLATCETIRLAAQAADIQLSVHAPYFINLNADSEEWPKSRKRLMDAAYFGHMAGATDIVFHPGSYFGQEPRQVLQVALPRLQACREELDAKGVSAVLRPETMGKSAMLGSLEDVIVFSAEVRGVEPCIDFAHLHARPGDGSANSLAEWSAILDRIEAGLGARALQRLHIHLSGIEYGPKGERNHLTFEQGDLRYRDLLKSLRDRGCAGRILCESPILEQDALLLKRAWARGLRATSGRSSSTAAGKK